MYRRLREGALRGDHYEAALTKSVGLERSFYTGKRILDVGCGPRGSLEWAEDAAERVGLDPLVPAYKRLGSGRHAMRYVAGTAERMPFPNDAFDVVTCFNALDHVEDVDAAAAEITRVTKAGGHLVLVTDVNHKPTRTEPQTFGWEIVDRFRGWDLVTERHLERGDTVYDSLSAGVPYDFANESPRYGLLIAVLCRRYAREDPPNTPQ
jgi:SAM-dependent methyltransferase